MTWSGHVHVYERTCPILYHTCLGYDTNGIPNAPVHMAIGNGGVRPYMLCAQCPLILLTGSQPIRRNAYVDMLQLWLHQHLC